MPSGHESIPIRGERERVEGARAFHAVRTRQFRLGEDHHWCACGQGHRLRRRCECDPVQHEREHPGGAGVKRRSLRKHIRKPSHPGSFWPHGIWHDSHVLEHERQLCAGSHQRGEDDLSIHPICLPVHAIREHADHPDERRFSAHFDAASSRFSDQHQPESGPRPGSSGGGGGGGEYSDDFGHRAWLLWVCFHSYRREQEQPARVDEGRGHSGGDVCQFQLVRQRHHLHSRAQCVRCRQASKNRRE
mmetsp:Transcript_41241/g.96359  ORF Transcript_41241/g.96359 Transcript_41241/m.96359 type:complete len:246 (+) Transcript_41241:831-1568(+)